MTKRTHGDLNGSTTQGTDAKNSSTEPLIFLEFYSGIGGWSMALQEALTSVTDDSLPLHPMTPTCAAALDHSDLCVAVYQHNHQQKGVNATNAKGKKKSNSLSNRAVRIEQITLEQLQECQATVWMMSPPCQPHTRQHSNQADDLVDPRSASFLHLCNLLETLPAQHRPALILLENVVGFDQSASCRRWRQALQKSGYSTAHFVLTPVQVALPNDRPRYYCVAVQQISTLARVEQDATTELLPIAAAAAQKSASLRHYFQQEDDVSKPPVIHTSIPELQVTAIDAADCPLPRVGDFLDPCNDSNSKTGLSISPQIAQRNAAWCFDICTAASTHTACFTSSYGKYVRGTGSVLYTGQDVKLLQRFQQRQPAAERDFDADWSQGLDLEHDVRYFAGTEMARLFGFPASFEFPPAISRKQQWKLMGNSLNVRVAARLLELGLRLVRPASLAMPKKT